MEEYQRMQRQEEEELTGARSLLGKPFEFGEELTAKRQRLKEVMGLLQRDTEIPGVLAAA